LQPSPLKQGEHVSAKPKTVDVSIMGRSYKVACTDEELDSLLAAVAYVDAKMNEIKSAGRVASLERVAVMAALNITHELLSLKSAPVGMAPAQAAARTTDGFDIEGLKRRMSSMQAMLDDVLLPQDRLI
jgi:cell division protein ZapA